MTAQPRPAARLAAVAALYWFALLAGVVLYTALRIDSLDAGSPLWPIWVGAISGTAIGQLAAALRVRLWLVAVVVVVIVTILGPALVGGLDRSACHALWRAFLPAAACGYFSLGDRGALAAFWFPAMLWMLSILDRTGARAVLDRGGMVLLGALALMFALFLRMRESRRLALWSTVAAAPLATDRKVTVLAEHPGGELGRAAWSVLALAGALAATSWAAPLMWQRESLRRPSPPPPIASASPPCCPMPGPRPGRASRWSEYFDIGRTDDDADAAFRPPALCQLCVQERGALIGLGNRLTVHRAEDGIATLVPIDDDVPGVPVDVGPDDQAAVAGNAPGVPLTTVSPATGSVARLSPGDTPVPPTATPRPVAPAPAAPPTARPPIAPPPVAPPPVAPPPRIETPPVAPPPIAAPSSPPPPPAAPTALAPPPDRDQITEPASPPGDGGSILRGVALLLGALLLLRTLTLALRPLRRLVVLRHLREPWWPETVDQQVSNSWQLVLIGLRDAGWRWSAAETPHELARRAGADSLADCATILDRARHGLGVDADDVTAMRAAADVAYRSARSPLGLAARIAAQLRSPLT